MVAHYGEVGPLSSVCASKCLHRKLDGSRPLMAVPSGWHTTGRRAGPKKYRANRHALCPRTQGLRLLSAGADRAFRVFSTIQDQQSRELSQGHTARRAKRLKVGSTRSRGRGKASGIHVPWLWLILEGLRGSEKANTRLVFAHMPNQPTNRTTEHSTLARCVSRTSSWGA